MNARLAYLETQLTTANPAKRRLLLIEAALRLARLCRLTGESTAESAARELCDLRKVILHLLSSIDATDSDVGQDAQRVYKYLFTTVTRAQLSREMHQIDDVIDVLEIERETWRELANRYLVELFDGQTRDRNAARQLRRLPKRCYAQTVWDESEEAAWVETSFSVVA